MADAETKNIVTCVKGPSGGPWLRAEENEKPVEENTKLNTDNDAGGGKGGKRKSKKSSKKGTKKTRKNKKSNKKGKKTQKGGSSLSHSDVNASQSVDNKLSLAGSIESGLFPGVQKITGGMNMGGMNMGGMNMGGTTTPKSIIKGGSGCSAKMLGGKKGKKSLKMRGGEITNEKKQNIINKINEILDIKLDDSNEEVFIENINELNTIASETNDANIIASVTAINVDSNKTGDYSIKTQLESIKTQLNKESEIGQTDDEYINNAFNNSDRNYKANSKLDNPQQKPRKTHHNKPGFGSSASRFGPYYSNLSQKRHYPHIKRGGKRTKKTNRK